MDAIRRSFTGLLVCCFLACGPGVENPADLAELRAMSRQTGVKILLIGIDGATLDVIRPLAESGELPNFKRLMAGGASGPLQSRKPMLSPAVWTTLLTGKLRSKHGITDFGDQQKEVLVTSNDRRVLALWNIASTFGIESGWTAFWATWPAEPIRGWMISDKFARSRLNEWTDGVKREHVTFPEDLTPGLAPLLVDPDDPPLDEIRRLVELTPAEIEEALSFEKPRQAHGLSVLKFAFCAQRSYEAMALEMLEQEGQPDLMGVFLIATDPISHTFWHFWQPEEYRGVDPALARRLGQAVPGIYRHNDAYLGELLARIDRDTVVLIVSDHGFTASGEVPRTQDVEPWEVRRRTAARIGQVAVGQSGKHHVDGTLVAAGGPIRRGVRVRARIQDVMPTILALLGLPVARDLDGEVIDGLIEPDFLERHPVREIRSYESLVERIRVDPDRPADDSRMLEQLRALGYIS